MVVLALRSIRHRPGALVASFVSLVLGATIIMTFASMLDTRSGVDPASAAKLLMMACAVGGWGLVVVVTTVTSTLALLVRQRYREMALLRAIGATPGQLGRMVTTEAVAVAVVAAALAIAPSVFAARLLVRLLRDGELVGQSVTARYGVFAVGIGFGVTVLAAAIAAGFATRRPSATRASEALVQSTVDEVRLGRGRAIGGGALLAAGLSCGVVTATVLDGRDLASMAVGGQGAILAAAGFALLAPALLRGAAAALRAPLRRYTGAGGYLTAHNLRERAREMGGVLVPILLFTGIATGTLYMQDIENASGTPKPEIAGSIELLNYVVIGMITLFAALMVVNTVVAATVHRRGEFGRQRLAGSTPPQVLGMVGLESAVLAATGVLFGSAAAVVTVVPYSIMKTGSPVPGTGSALWLAIGAAAVAVTLAAGISTARRVLRTPAVEAIAG